MFGSLKKLFTRASSVELGHPRDPALVQWFGSISTKSGVAINEQNALQLTAVWACITLLADSISTLPCNVYRRLDNGGREIDRMHRLFRLLHNQPNPWQTSVEFWSMLLGHRLLRGNGYAEIVTRTNGMIEMLVPLHPDRVTPVWTKKGTVAYRYRPMSGVERIIMSGEMFHLRGFSLDGLAGMSPIMEQRESLGIARATEDHAASMYGNGTRIGGILKHPGVLDEEAAARQREQWQKNYAGSGNAYKTAVLESGMEWQSMGMTAKEAEFIANRKHNIADIARIYRVPPHMIGDLERATFSNIEHQDIAFVRHTLRPILVSVEQSAWRDLLTEREKARNTHYVEFKVDGLMRGDSQAQSEFFSKAIQFGWMTRNEVRALYNLDPLEGGDEGLVPLNLVPSSQIGELQAAEQVGNSRALQLEHRQGQEGQQYRSMQARRRLRRAYEGIFRTACERVARREQRDVEKMIAKQLAERSVEDLVAWLDGYYRDLVPFVSDSIAAGIRSYSMAVAGEAAVELGVDVESVSVDDFVGEYIDSAARSYTASSHRQLRALIASADPDQLAQLLRERISEWQEKRGGKFANKHVVQAEGAVTREFYKRAGVRRLRWVSYNVRPCPLCRSVNQKVVGVDSPFMNAGDTIEQEGSEPMVLPQTVRHPPLHRGCDCHIVAEG